MKRAALITGLVLLLSLTLQPATVSAGWTILGYHVVRPGESLYCIGRAYGVSPWAIASQNGIVNVNRIYPGLVLAIPAVYASLPPGPVCTPQFGTFPSYPCACKAYYTIVSGDTLLRIAMRFGVSAWRIAECNHIYNLNYIRAGDTICIPADP